jgi:hypothetical protein
MRRRRTFAADPDNSLVDGALAALSADELRELIPEMLRELDGRSLDRVVNSIIDRAARSGSGWTPDGPSTNGIASIHSFAEAAARVGYADPSEVDGYLRQGSNAFLRKDYRACAEIFRALLIPIAEVEIDLGYHEMPDEVLGIDVATCAAQYVMATYMTTAPRERALAVRSAIAAPGLGWSDREHVGYLLFPLFQGLLEGATFYGLPASVHANEIDIDELEWTPTDPKEAQLVAPEIGDLLRLAGVDSRPDAAAQKFMRKAMRKAAEKRVAGITSGIGQKRPVVIG